MGTEKVGYELTLRDLMSKGLGDINSKLKSLETNLKSTEKAGEKAGMSMASAFKLVGGAVAAREMFEFGKQVVFTTAKFQSLANSIKFASDSSVEGESSMIWVSQLSKKYGLPIQETAEGFKTLQGAMMKTKFTSGDTRKMFAQVSTGIIAMGLSAEDAKGTFLALGQIMGKGKVQAEELRGQIGERIPGAFAIAARAMGKTTAELDKMMKDGKLLSEDFLPKFAAEMEKTFGKGAEGSVNSLSSSLTRLSNSWTEMMVSIGNSDENGLMGKTFNFLAKAIDNIGNSFKSLDQKSREAINPDLIKYLDSVNDKERLLGDSLKKKGYKKEQIAGIFEENRGNEAQRLDFEIAQNRSGMNALAVRIANTIGKKGSMTEKQADSLVDDQFTRPSSELSHHMLFYDQAAKDAFYKAKNRDTLLRNERKGLTGAYDKLTSDLYKPGNKTDAELEKESNSISGHTPKTVNINVEALIKDSPITNNIGNVNNPQGDLANFMSRLEQSLLTVVNDVNIITE